MTHVALWIGAVWALVVASFGAGIAWGVHEARLLARRAKRAIDEAFAMGVECGEANARSNQAKRQGRAAGGRFAKGEKR